MNAHGSSRRHEVADLASMLPVPAERDLPAGRRLIIKEHLMTEFRTGEPSAPRAGRARRPRRPRRTALTAAGVGLLAAAAAAASVLGLSGNSGPHPGPRGTISAPKLLRQIADVAVKQHPQDVTDSQFAYIASRELDPRTPGQTHLDESWIPVSDLCREKFASRDGKRYRINNEEAVRQGYITCPYRGTLNAPTYRLLQALPTDPRTLLNLIHDQEKGAGNSPDQEAFVTIGDLLRGSIAPPGLSAALYRAAALIPGVQAVPDAVDVLGRHGVAVSFTFGGVQDEWIFDKTTLQWLGETEHRNGKLIVSSALVARAFVDRAGEVPPAS